MKFLASTLFKLGKGESFLPECEDKDGDKLFDPQVLKKKISELHIAFSPKDENVSVEQSNEDTNNFYDSLPKLINELIYLSIPQSNFAKLGEKSISAVVIAICSSVRLAKKR